MASEGDSFVQVVNSFDEHGKRTYFFAECQLPLQPPDSVLEQDPNLKMRHKKINTIPLKAPNMPILTIDLEPSPVKFTPCCFYDYNNGAACDTLVHPEVGYCDQHLQMAKDISTSFESTTRSLRLSSYCRRQLFSGGKHGVKFSIVPEVEDYGVGDEPDQDNDISVILNTQRSIIDGKQYDIMMPNNMSENKPSTSTEFGGSQSALKRNLNRFKPGSRPFDPDAKPRRSILKHQSIDQDFLVDVKKRRREFELQKFGSIFSEAELEVMTKGDKEYLDLITAQAREGRFAFGLSRRSTIHRVSRSFDCHSRKLTMGKFADICIKVPFRKFLELLTSAWAAQDKKIAHYYEGYIRPLVRKLIRKKIIKIRYCGVRAGSKDSKSVEEEAMDISDVVEKPSRRYFTEFPEGYCIFRQDRTLLDYYKEFVFKKYPLIRHHPRFGRAGRAITAQKFSCRIPRSVAKLLPQLVLQQLPTNQGTLPGRCASFSARSFLFSINPSLAKMKKSGSNSDSSVPPSPTGVRKSKKKKEKIQTLDKLRKMTGCDQSISNLELIQHIIDHINRLRAVLDKDQPEGISNVENLLHTLSFTSEKIESTESP
ncbi:hypothetical protein FO519_005768 [Halicephalobus sp. NKZ332]|nr:hypothetical protein FO519_005768 [Halicephalobus sp. NKZ332]